jgi:hypothetical protein
MQGKGTFLAIEDIFERVRTHLLTQQCRSEDADGEPRYRGLQDRRCGVGILIDDAFYCPATIRLHVRYATQASMWTTAAWWTC